MKLGEIVSEINALIMKYNLICLTIHYCQNKMLIKKIFYFCLISCATVAQILSFSIVIKTTFGTG